MSPESMTQLKNMLAARKQAQSTQPRQPNRGGGGRGGGGMRWGGGGWGGWGGYYPYNMYYPYYYNTYQYSSPRVYFDGVNYWLWNGYQWVIYPTSYRYGSYVLGRSQNPSVGACTACGVTEEVSQQAASPGPRFRPYFQGQQIPNPMQAYHYGRWGNNTPRTGLTMMQPVRAPARGTWLPALSNQLMPAPAGIGRWVVWPGGDYGLLHQAGIGVTQMVSVIGSRAGGPTGLEVLVTQRILG